MSSLLQKRKLARLATPFVELILSPYNTIHMYTWGPVQVHVYMYMYRGWALFVLQFYILIAQ